MNKPDKYLELYKEYQKGLSLKQVGDLIGVSRQSVYKAFKSRNLDLRKPNYQEFQYFDNKKITLRNTGYLSLTTGNRCLMHRYVWQFYNGEIPENYDIHHINHNKTDNRIENLELISKSDHARIYSTGNNQYIKRNRTFRRDWRFFSGGANGGY